MAGEHILIYLKHELDVKHVLIFSNNNWLLNYLTLREKFPLCQLLHACCWEDLNRLV